jgi:phosphate transport system ATP-binding protein
VTIEESPVSDLEAPEPYARLVGSEVERASFAGGSVIQLVEGDPSGPDATVVDVYPATVVVTSERLVAVDEDLEWEWYLDDLDEVHHGGDEPWTIVAVPGVSDHGVAVLPGDVAEFRRVLARARLEAGQPPTPWDTEPAADLDLVDVHPPAGVSVYADPAESPDGDSNPDGESDDGIDVSPLVVGPLTEPDVPIVVAEGDGGFAWADEPEAPLGGGGAATRLRSRLRLPRRVDSTAVSVDSSAPLADLEAREISAWFGNHHVLDRVSLTMHSGEVTALIGPSGCGKSTFLRILNRMHEMISTASLSGEVLLDGEDIYDVNKKLADARRHIGMVFQKPNPFPAMSIYDNVVASFRLTGLKVSGDAKDEVVEACLTKAGLWTEVRDRLRMPGGGLSGGQQQRLCIARALAIRPRVLLMDEPCSALDPTSTRRIEQTITELASEVTIVIVTHNMQQAARVSDQCAFFLAEQGTPGVIVEHGPTDVMFEAPQDERTNDYVNGRFG